MAASLLLCACATSPERKPSLPLEIPETWATSADATTPTAWLSDFRAPELEALVLEALGNNPGLEATAARFAQTIAEARIAGAERMPSAGLGLSGNKQKINSFGPASTGGVVFENYDLALNLSWELDLWWLSRDPTSAALSRVEGRGAELYGVQKTEHGHDHFWGLPLTLVVDKPIFESFAWGLVGQLQPTTKKGRAFIGLKISYELNH